MSLLLHQARSSELLRIFAARVGAGGAVAWAGIDAPHLYVTAIIAVILKVVIIRAVPNRQAVSIHRKVETVIGIRPRQCCRRRAGGIVDRPDTAVTAPPSIWREDLPLRSP